MRTTRSILARLALLALTGTGCLAQGLSPSEVDAGAGPTFDPNAEATACALDVQIFQPSCAGCHRPGGQVPDLTFDGLPALLNGRYVVPSNPPGSLLYRKISNTMAANEGGVMPPSGTLPADRVAFVEQWIREGASFDCEPSGEVVTPTRYHPDDFALPEVHGPELKQGLQDCRECHGADLTGGAGPSCDDCHMEGWRTTCTFCHGGTLDSTGAPPRDLSGATNLLGLTFGPHPEHVGGERHPPYDCTTCHAKPTDPLTPGHTFDDTPGQAEVRFDEGLSAGGTYAAGECSNVYCHGDGRTNGRITREAGARLCDSCHAGPASGRAGWSTMSGEHEAHLRKGVKCVGCHGATIDDADRIIGPMQHVDGEVDLAFEPGTITRTGATCSGTCHAEEHDAEVWSD